MPRTEFITPGDCEPLELAPDFHVRVLVSGAKGASGLTTCVASAQPGTGLAYHTHPTGEAREVKKLRRTVTAFLFSGYGTRESLFSSDVSP